MAAAQPTLVPAEKPTSPRFKDLTGQEFERLTVDNYYGFRRTSSGVSHCWACTCACGNTLVVSRGALLSGHQRSCGCLRAECSSDRLLKHGETRIGRKSREYNIYYNMLTRCLNTDNEAYPSYGGRGIIVCERWQGEDGFIHFLEDMGRCPPKRSLDRLNNDGPYSKDNCEWRTQRQQCRNTRVNVNIEYLGRTQCVTAWAEEIGLQEGTLRYRLKHWSLERAMTAPKR